MAGGIEGLLKKLLSGGESPGNKGLERAEKSLARAVASQQAAKAHLEKILEQLRKAPGATKKTQINPFMQSPPPMPGVKKTQIQGQKKLQTQLMGGSRPANPALQQQTQQQSTAVPALSRQQQSQQSYDDLLSQSKQARKDVRQSKKRVQNAKKAVEQAKPSPFEGFGSTAGKIFGENSATAKKFETVELAGKVAKGGKGSGAAAASLIGQGVDKVKQTAKNIKQGAGMMVSGLGTAMSSDRIESQGKGLSTMTKGFGKMLGPIGKPLEALGGLGETVFESIEAFRKLNESMHDANMKFAEFSGSMAAVKAQREVQDIMLSMDRGERRAESAEALSDSQVELNQRLAVIEDYIANLFNWFMSDVNKFITKVLDWLSKGKLKKEDDDRSVITFTEMLENEGAIEAFRRADGRVPPPRRF